MGNKQKGTQRGFTLIELLVVIAIIGMLSSVVLSSLNSARIKSRDATRMAQLGQIRVALELYFLDYGYYPPSNCGWDCNGYRYSYDAASWAIFRTALAPYMSQVPVDPVNTACPPWGDNCYSYTYGNVGRDTNVAQYDLTGQLEDPNNRYRCGIRNHRLYFNASQPWCTAFGGSYSNQIIEVSPL